MADQPDQDEKTEAPTEHRKEEARRKGERLTSKELGTAMAGVAAALWVTFFIGTFASGMRTAATNSLTLTRADIIDFTPDAALFTIANAAIRPFLILFVLMLAGALAGQALTGGLGFTLESIRFQGSRLNPLSGLKRMFGVHGLIELAKSLLKTLVLVGLSALLLKQAIPLLLALPRQSFGAALSTIDGLGRKLITWLTLGLMVIAAVDIPAQILQWIRKMRMTKQEVKDEYKEQEGSPEVKQAQRRRAQQMLKEANRKAVADATVVLTNPTHFAIALRYQPESDVAPVIVARGRGAVAEAIRAVAREHDVPVLSYPSVTRAIYFTGKVGEIIRADLYVAVATILAFVMRVGAGYGAAPEAEAPESARFNEFGERL